MGEKHSALGASFKLAPRTPKFLILRAAQLIGSVCAFGPSCPGSIPKTFTVNYDHQCNWLQEKRLNNVDQTHLVLGLGQWQARTIKGLILDPDPQEYESVSCLRWLDSRFAISRGTHLSCHEVYRRSYYYMSTTQGSKCSNKWPTPFAG